MSAAISVVVDQNVGEFIWFGAGLLTFKVTSEQSGGAFLLLEDATPQGKTTPLHVHVDHDEVVYVVDGELLLHVNGTERRAGAGSVVSLPRGNPHAFLVTSESARLIVLVTPGDARAEAFFREGGTPAPARATPPAGTRLDIERLLAAGTRTGFMRVLGPPPFPAAVESAGRVG